MRLNETTRRDCGQLLSVVLLYMCMHWIPCALGCRAHLSVWWEEGAFCMERLAVFPLPFDPLYFLLFIRVTGAWFLGGCRGSWPGCQVLPAIDAVSILELAANSGGSRMSQAPNLHLATQLLIIGHFQKYHNTLCLPSKILHKHCFHFPLGPTMVPRENKNNVYAKF